MDDVVWKKVFGVMSIPVILNIVFLFANSIGWIFAMNIIVLICSFLLFITARVWEMKGIDVALIMIVNIVTFILNLLYCLKVL